MPLPSIPATPSPADAATYVSTTPTLTWTAAGATSCRVYLSCQLGTERFGPGPVGPGLLDPPMQTRSGIGILSGGTFTFDTNSGGVPTGGLAPLATLCTFSWRVDAINASGVTRGPIWTFTTTGARPLVPQAPTPASGATARTFTLTWAVAAGAVTYDVYFGTVNPPVTLVSADQAGTSYTATVSAGTTYYWQVVAKNAYGSTSGAVWSFLAAAPTTPVIVSPPDTGQSITLSPTLIWAASDGAVNYDVYFDTANPPTTLVSSAQAGTSYAPAGPLTNLTTYYWKIIARNSAGTTNGPVWRFIAALEDVVTVFTTTSTGSQNDFTPGTLTNINVLRANNASLLTITGLSAPATDGTMLWIESIGAGQVDLKNQDGGSSAANRVINNVTATISLAAGVGRALLVYDATTGRWRVLEHEQGAWIAVPYSAGDYSASGSMTITPSTPSKHAYWLKGRTLVYELDAYASWTIGGTLSTTVYVAIPGGFAAQGQGAAPAIIIDNGTSIAGSVQIGIGPDVTKFHFDKLTSANWSAATSTSGVIVTFSFEVQ